jgi:hypothetical protein
MTKFELLAGFLMSGMSLMLRMQIYKVEQTLVSAALEFGVRAAKAAGTVVPHVFRICRWQRANSLSE